MTDILDRAKTCQREHAQGTTVTIRLAFLQDLIAEIEMLQAEVARNRPQSLHEVWQRNEPKAVPFSSGRGSEEPQ